MGELVGDIAQPSELILPVNEGVPSASPQTGTIFYDSDAGKVKFWTGSTWETITSA